MDNRKEIAEAFKRAKEILWDGTGYEKGYTYICHAIRHDNEYFSSAGYEAVKVIQERLDGYYTVDSWLDEVAGVHYSLLTAERMQPYRHAWLDSLIAEYSK